MAEFLQRLPLLLVAAILLVASAAKSDTQLTTATLSAGLVVLGAWLSVEIVRLWQQASKENEEIKDQLDAPRVDE